MLGWKPQIADQAGQQVQKLKPEGFVQAVLKLRLLAQAVPVAALQDVAEVVVCQQALPGLKTQAVPAVCLCASLLQGWLDLMPPRVCLHCAICPKQQLRLDHVGCLNGDYQVGLTLCCHLYSSHL